MEENTEVSKDINDELTKMESYTMIINREAEYCKDVNSPQIHAKFQCSPDKNSNSFPFSSKEEQRAKNHQDIQETCPIRYWDFCKQCCTSIGINKQNLWTN